MTEDKPRRGLGRGLSALLGDTPLDSDAPIDTKGTIQVPVGRMQSGRYQPRMEFDQDALQDLADSIRAKGILQPILVRPLPEDSSRYEIIAGERRWRAAQLAQVHSVPVLVRDFSDREAAEVALIENLQRRDLSALEEAEGYRRLMDDFARSQEDLAQALGKSRSHVANMIRLLSLPEPVKVYLRDGRLTAGHARALLNAEDPGVLAQQVVQKGLNVRQTEKLATDKGGVKARRPRPPKEKDTDTLALERDLARVLGLKVGIEFQGRGGQVVIHYETLEQLDDILYRLNNPSERHRPVTSTDSDEFEADNAAFAASFGRIEADDEQVIGAMVAAADPDTDTAVLDGSVDSWEAELAAEQSAEAVALLENPYADQVEDDDGDLAIDEVILGAGDAMDDDARLAIEIAASDDSALFSTDDQGDAPDAGAILDALRHAVADEENSEDADALLDASADAWAESLNSETAAERVALIASADDDDETDDVAEDDENQPLSL